MKIYEIFYKDVNGEIDCMEIEANSQSVAVKTFMRNMGEGARIQRIRKVGEK